MPVPLSAKDVKLKDKELTLVQYLGANTLHPARSVTLKAASSKFVEKVLRSTLQFCHQERLNEN